MSDFGDIDTGHEHGDLAAGHEDYGQEHDHNEQFAVLAEAHAQEHDEAYAHGHHVEYEDGRGGHYAESDYTVYNEHDAASDNVFAEDYSDHDHAEAYADVSALQEHFDHLVVEHEPAVHELTPGGHEGVHEFGPSEHYEPDAHR